jgi:hypothetical protein
MKTKLIVLVFSVLMLPLPLPAPIVSYATVFVFPGYNLLSNPLSFGITNGANEIMAPIDGEVILTYNGSTFDYASYQASMGGWVDADFQPSSPPSLPPGKGFFLYNPGAQTNITFTGQIVPGPASTNIITLPPGYSLVGSRLPANVTNITSSPVNLPLIDGMLILRWNVTNYIMFAYDKAFGGWIDGDFNYQPAPAYNLGEGFFFFNPGHAVDWVQSLP